VHIKKIKNAPCSTFILMITLVNAHCNLKQCDTFIFYNSFGKCKLILIILSLLHSQTNYTSNRNKISVPHCLKSIAALPVNTQLHNCIVVPVQLCINGDTSFLWFVYYFPNNAGSQTSQPILTQNGLNDVKWHTFKKVYHTPPGHRWGAHLPLIAVEPIGEVCDAWPVRHQTYGYLWQSKSRHFLNP